MKTCSHWSNWSNCGRNGFAHEMEVIGEDAKMNRLTEFGAAKVLLAVD